MSDDASNQRRHRRYPGRAPIVLISPQEETTYLTENFSLGGIFVRTDSPRPLRHLVRFGFTPPEQDAPLKMLAMVVYIVTPAQAARLGRAPGMGLNLYGMDQDTRDRWRAFVQQTGLRLQEQTQVQPPPQSLRPGLPTEPIRRHDPRTTAEFKVQLKDASQLYEVYTCDISLGGTFLRSAWRPPAGQKVELVFIHPDDGSEFTLRGSVIRHVDGPASQRGFGVAFEALGPETRSQFHTFIESGLPILDGDEDLIVEEGDPLLE